MEQSALIQHPDPLDIDEVLDPHSLCPPMKTHVRILFVCFISFTTIMGALWLFATICALGLPSKLPKEVEDYHLALALLKNTIFAVGVETVNWFCIGASIVVIVAHNKKRNARYECMLIWLVCAVGGTFLSSLLLGRVKQSLALLQNLAVGHETAADVAFVELMTLWSPMTLSGLRWSALILAGFMAHADGILNFHFRIIAPAQSSE